MYKMTIRYCFLKIKGMGCLGDLVKHMTHGFDSVHDLGVLRAPEVLEVLRAPEVLELLS